MPLFTSSIAREIVGEKFLSEVRLRRDSARIGRGTSDAGAQPIGRRAEPTTWIRPAAVPRFRLDSRGRSRRFFARPNEPGFFTTKERRHEHRAGRLRFLLNLHDRRWEEDYFCARVLTEAAHWLEQNYDAERFFLVVESFDPHEPWFVLEWYRRPLDDSF